MKLPRLYHSTAVLLPDARVVSGGGGEGGAGVIESNIEVFSPPYLFNSDGTPATRPTIAGAPATLGYNASFDVQTPDAATIAQVTLVRLATATHGSNFNQRFLRLPFTKGTGALTVTSPLKNTVAPPGHYMMFLVDAKGVPSTAKIIRIQ